MSLNNYMTSGELLNYVQGYDSSTVEVKNMITSKMSGVEALPYQFLPNVDRRINGTEMGRKYGEKIISRLPLLFLTPCKQVFMDDFNDVDKETVASWLIDSGLTPTEELLEGKGKYYSVEFDYVSYYSYLQIMLQSVIAFLGLGDEEYTINGKTRRLININWANDELNEDFKRFFSSKENIVFYLDSINQVSESFTNDTADSSLASQINGYADTANEIRFLFGKGGESIASTASEIGSDILSSVSSAFSGVLGNLGGGIVQSLADKGVNTVLNGGKIAFPKIWSNSSYSRSYSLNIKLRSPDHDSLSIFMNVLKPYCKLLCFAMAKMADNNPNGYKSPFLVKAYSKGIFNIDMGMITSMNVTKGDECCWNDDGLPTQIDIGLDIEDLYSTLAMSDQSNMFNVVNNTSYMDYLANMAGLNIAQMEVGRRIKMFYYLERNKLLTTPSRLFTRFEQGISKVIGRLYNITS